MDFKNVLKLITDVIWRLFCSFLLPSFWLGLTELNPADGNVTSTSQGKHYHTNSACDYGWQILLKNFKQYSFQNKDFDLLDIWSCNLANVGGPMEILPDRNVLCIMMT